MVLLLLLLVGKEQTNIKICILSIFAVNVCVCVFVSAFIYEYDGEPWYTNMEWIIKEKKHYYNRLNRKFDWYYGWCVCLYDIVLGERFVYGLLDGTIFHKSTFLKKKTHAESVINYLVDGICLMFAYGVSANWSYPSPLSFELSQCVLCCGRNRLPGSTLPPIRAAECSFPGNALPGCRFDGIRKTFRWTRDVMVDPVDMVIRITAKRKRRKRKKPTKYKLNLCCFLFCSKDENLFKNLFKT